ncbi:MAG: biosynthetic arginine decarboxylase [Myxococcota bacterium]|nr:biosynthetic arginine decarboxylase [Myxococcota bacterium]
MDKTWSIQKSLELYAVERWGDGFFYINDSGHLVVRPRPGETSEIDLLELMGDLRRRGLRTPMLIRFSDILASRIEALADAFQSAIDDAEYPARFRGVYPIKVNQQRHVVEEIVQYGRSRGVGLEAGSKPELLIAIASLDTPDALIICNGFKDRAYVETAMLAQRLGRTSILVVDRFSELELIIKTARELGIRPRIGLRARLTAQGSGRWHESSGRRSKFGLSPSEIVKAVERLRIEDLLDCLTLLHCHIGSQITSIRAHKEALREVAQIYVGLRALGAEALELMDVGGGLAVDYDGSQSDLPSSANYRVQEYANDVVDALQRACHGANVPVPDLVTESGRSMVAHHSVLLFDVIGANQMLTGDPPPPVGENAHPLLVQLEGVRETIQTGRVEEAYHDAVQIRDEAASLFALGHLDLPCRAQVDALFLHCCEKIHEAAAKLDPVPEDLSALAGDLADTYFGNFSVFQSAPDHWAVRQLFPIMPIHRLNEPPQRQAAFADLTCDSDGKIDRFINREEGQRTLELHEFDGRPYYLGVFLVGAYQEILGDLHNLFGDTDAVHVRLHETNGYEIEHVVEGDEVSEVLSYVQYDIRALQEGMRRTIESALRAGRIDLDDSRLLRRRFEEGLRQYTYLSGDD